MKQKTRENHFVIDYLNTKLTYFDILETNETINSVSLEQDIH